MASPIVIAVIAVIKTSPAAARTVTAAWTVAAAHAKMTWAGCSTEAEVIRDAFQKTKWVAVRSVGRPTKELSPVNQALGGVCGVCGTQLTTVCVWGGGDKERGGSWGLVPQQQHTAHSTPHTAHPTQHTAHSTQTY